MKSLIDWFSLMHKRNESFHKESFLNNLDFSELAQNASIAKKIELRNLFAGMAMQGLLSNPKLQPEILKNGGAFGGWIESSALSFANSLIEHIEKENEYPKFKERKK